MMTPEDLRKLVSIKYNAWVPISAIAEIQRDAREGMVLWQDVRPLVEAIEWVNEHYPDGMIAGALHSLRAKHPNLFTK